MSAYIVRRKFKHFSYLARDILNFLLCTKFPTVYVYNPRFLAKPLMVLNGTLVGNNRLSHLDPGIERKYALLFRPKMPCLLHV